jgi:hypothetical protein
MATKIVGVANCTSLPFSMTVVKSGSPSNPPPPIGAYSFTYISGSNESIPDATPLSEYFSDDHYELSDSNSQNYFVARDHDKGLTYYSVNGYSNPISLNDGDFGQAVLVIQPGSPASLVMVPFGS